MKKIHVYEVKQAYEFDIEMLTADKKNSNRSKLIQRDRLMLQILDTLPDTLAISCEGTVSDSYKLNAGSLTECAIKYHMAKGALNEVEKSGGRYDAKRGCIDVEIKLSVNGSCYNTPIKEKALIYLVNRDGVYMVKKDEIDEVAPKGKLPYTEWEGAKKIVYLSKALGFDVE